MRAILCTDRLWITFESATCFQIDESYYTQNGTAQSMNMLRTLRAI
jgi:hypothetical protein